MEIEVEEIIEIINSVGSAATARKRYLDAVNANGSDISDTLKWYRKRKNIELKDALTYEGLKRGFSVRAEKTMGALPEYGSRKDEKNFDRFDLSWERSVGSKDFILEVEIEMDLNAESIVKDFKKLIKNKCICLKVMICQARNESEVESIKSEVEKYISTDTVTPSPYLLSIWSWVSADFIHYKY